MQHPGQARPSQVQHLAAGTSVTVNTRGQVDPIGLYR